MPATLKKFYTEKIVQCADCSKVLAISQALVIYYKNFNLYYCSPCWTIVESASVKSQLTDNQ
jgi:DNA-directed RNA polymerase subunit RPC12/RpoP